MNHHTSNNQIIQKKSFLDFHSLPYSNKEGYLEKKGSLNTSWKRRYFALSSGTLKYYAKGPQGTGGALNAVDYKGQIVLQGAMMSCYKMTRFTINCADEKKTVLVIRASNTTEAAEWEFAINSEIDRANILALKSGSRMPEVMEWYFRRQSEVKLHSSSLDKPLQVNLSYPAPGRTGTMKESAVVLALSSDRLGISIGFSDKGRKFDSVENLYNGRIIDLSDILGLDMAPQVARPTVAVPIPTSGLFVFSLVTREDTLTFSVREDGGGPWLAALRETASFMTIPSPSSRNIAATGSPMRSAGGAMNVNTTTDRGSISLSSIGNGSMEFSQVSGQVFHSSGDVQLFLQAMRNSTSVGGGDTASSRFQFPVIADVARLFSEILRALSEVKCNKEIACQFGERLEDVIRVIGDTSNGLLVTAKPSDGSLVYFHMSSLSAKLSDCLEFLRSISRSGWLSVLLKPSNSPNLKFKAMDTEITSVTNLMINALGDSSMAFAEMRFEVGVDVKKAVFALGGVDGIYRDSSKQRALSKLIAASTDDVQDELRSLMLGDSASSRASTSSVSLYENPSYGTVNISDVRGSGDYGSWSGRSVNVYSGNGQSFIARLCCCIQPARSKPRISGNGRVELESRLMASDRL